MKTAFITGATGGVGRALAGVLEAEGYRLVISDRDESALEAMSFQLSHDPWRRSQKRTISNRQD